MRFVLLIAASLWIVPASAQTITLPDTEITQDIEGVTIRFPVAVSVAKVQDGEPLSVTAVVNLSDFIAKTDSIINAAWDKQSLDLGGKLQHRGTLLSIEETKLRAKVHFHVSPGGVIPASNGSTVAYFQPAVRENRIMLTGNITELNISNDITRNAAKALKIDGIVRDKLGELLSEALERPEASLGLPQAALILGATLQKARFEATHGTPKLIIEGSLPAAAGLIFNL